MTRAREYHELRNKLQAHGKRRGGPCRILQNPYKTNTIQRAAQARHAEAARLRTHFTKKLSRRLEKQRGSGKTYYATNPMGPSGAPSAPRGHKSSPRAHVGNPWENKGKLRFCVVPLCRVRGGISGEGFPDSNEFAAKFFANRSFSHVYRIPIRGSTLH